jgi:hypothetical protein
MLEVVKIPDGGRATTFANSRPTPFGFIGAKCTTSTEELASHRIFAADHDGTVIVGPRLAGE